MPHVHIHNLFEFVCAVVGESWQRAECRWGQVVKSSAEPKSLVVRLFLYENEFQIEMKRYDTNISCILCKCVVVLSKVTTFPT